MANHGVYVSEQSTSVSSPVVAKSGIPFVIGASPIQAAESPSAIGVPVLCTNWAEAVKALGYSDNWGSYQLCEFMYSHFKLYGCQPVIFCNVLDPSTKKVAVAATDMSISDHKAKLPIEAINDSTLVVKAAGGTGSAYVKDTDYSTYVSGEYLIVEALSSGNCYSAASLSISYNAVTPTSVTASLISANFEQIELCMNTVGMVPDLICAPGFSSDSTVAAIMATKAAGINGMFPAKAIIDIDTSAAAGADTYPEAIAAKSAKNLTDENEIVCWPLLKLGSRVFHYSTQLAGLMAQVDSENGCPYESPSNKSLQCDSMVVAAGTEVMLTLAQANNLNASGIVTALNFMGGWVAWGDYTACYPSITDVKDFYIPVSRMFDWVSRTIIRTFWSKVDKPMTRMLISSTLNTISIWFGGLVGSGYLYGARAEYIESENPLTSLLAGQFKIHLYLTPPLPAQETDFILEFDASYVTAALKG